MSHPIIIEQKVNAPAEKVWGALTNRNEMKIWYFDIPDFIPEVGAVFNFYEPGDERKYHHQAEILEIIPEKKLRHTWFYPEFSDQKTTVTWELEPQAESTLIRLIHENINGFNDLGENFSEKAFNEGWTQIIEQSLKRYLEN
ncbi:SRPBCC family protein [Chryseobacterium salviniae]|uniref:SRPBCC domain-containing protein n=1 Tax=Chryseobacterium salviniae TaxID=3101750 RepID=A0ABU6HTP5_9FLAO|nr:SRPBCC domain-containing protein [Chryseobacterium sp. T9W2-O]MEC3875287.1 SRPBCC domain-containing protein [Chryseobacterium sp. T9W2-O]